MDQKTNEKPAFSVAPRKYTRPFLKRFGTLAEVTSAVGTQGAVGDMSGELKTS